LLLLSLLELAATHITDDTRGRLVGRAFEAARLNHIVKGLEGTILEKKALPQATGLEPPRLTNQSHWGFHAAEDLEDTIWGKRVWQQHAAGLEPSLLAHRSRWGVQPPRLRGFQSLPPPSGATANARRDVAASVGAIATASAEPAATGAVSELPRPATEQLSTSEFIWEKDGTELPLLPERLTLPERTFARWEDFCPRETASPSEPMPGLLGPTVRHFERAVIDDGTRGSGLVPELCKTAFLNGMESFAVALNQLGGSLGDYLLTNVKKFRNSKAAARDEEDLRKWLVSELPLHKATRYKTYVDDSAWMANLWVGRILEFFVELFAFIQQGLDTKASVDQAYKQTLLHHHNFIQRSAFQLAAKKLPSREDMLEKLGSDDARASMSQEQILKQLAEFVSVGRLVARFCLQMDEEFVQSMRQERAAVTTR
jgi:hypothetical protein